MYDAKNTITDIVWTNKSWRTWLIEKEFFAYFLRHNYFSPWDYKPIFGMICMTEIGLTQGSLAYGNTIKIYLYHSTI